MRLIVLGVLAALMLASPAKTQRWNPPRATVDMQYALILCRALTDDHVIQQKKTKRPLQWHDKEVSETELRSLLMAECVTQTLNPPEPLPVSDRT
jgi:hypothetical protein